MKIIDQIRDGTRFKLKGLSQIDSFLQVSCYCDCHCDEDCSCSECEEDGCDLECGCECTCNERCQCVIGHHKTYECKHKHETLIKLYALNARILSDNKTHLLTNDNRRKLLAKLPLIQVKLKNEKEKRIYLYL